MFQRLFISMSFNNVAASHICGHGQSALYATACVYTALFHVLKIYYNQYLYRFFNWQLIRTCVLISPKMACEHCLYFIFLPLGKKPKGYCYGIHVCVRACVGTCSCMCVHLHLYVCVCVCLRVLSPFPIACTYQLFREIRFFCRNGCPIFPSWYHITN